LMEPWDGPAAIAFTDGRQVGAMLDRNGLRPARYTITKSGLMVLASEAGVLDIAPGDIAEKGALRPGQIILVDMENNRVIKDGEIKATYARKQPYRRWVEENKISLHGLFNDVAPVEPDTARLIRRQKLFGYTREDIQLILGSMASAGQEPVGSMGYDAPLAVLSEQPQMLYSYFKQLFAQITNPAIDPIRENIVMSLMTFMGNPPNILADDPRNCRLIKLKHPILSNEDTERLRAMRLRTFTVTTIPMGFPAHGGDHQLEESLEHLCSSVELAATGEQPLIILSDKDLPDHLAPIPALLAVSAANQRLVRRGMRTCASIIVETGEARDVHQIALLLGYGATAINPYLAFDCVADLATRKVLEHDAGVTKALENYIKALSKGLLKIMSKMGISTLRSYRGAQVFEAVGLHSHLVERYFTGTESRVGGIDLTDIAIDARTRYESARDKSPDTLNILPSGGAYRYRKDGERHLWNPDSISKLQLAARTNNYRLFKEYELLIDDQSERQSTLRGLFKFRTTQPV
ncbi:MAG: glutamate synthase central domain-containing protein, partial [bacterium]